jgi:hypothetical protein
VLEIAISVSKPAWFETNGYKRVVFVETDGSFFDNCAVKFCTFCSLSALVIGVAVGLGIAPILRATGIGVGVGAGVVSFADPPFA